MRLDDRLNWGRSIDWDEILVGFEVGLDGIGLDFEWDWMKLLVRLDQIRGQTLSRIEFDWIEFWSYSRLNKIELQIAFCYMNNRYNAGKSQYCLWMIIYECERCLRLYTLHSVSIIWSITLATDSRSEWFRCDPDPTQSDPATQNVLEPLILWASNILFLQNNLIFFRRKHFHWNDVTHTPACREV